MDRHERVSQIDFGEVNMSSLIIKGLEWKYREQNIAGINIAEITSQGKTSLGELIAAKNIAVKNIACTISSNSGYLKLEGLKLVQYEIRVQLLD